MKSSEKCGVDWASISIPTVAERVRAICGWSKSGA